MEARTCSHCGGSEFLERGDLLICSYCRSVFKDRLAKDRLAPKSSTTTIGVKSDVDRLLEKCAKEPAKAAKYASLVLDLDPMNKEALKYV